MGALKKSFGIPWINIGFSSLTKFQPGFRSIWKHQYLGIPPKAFKGLLDAFLHAVHGIQPHAPYLICIEVLAVK